MYWFCFSLGIVWNYYQTIPKVPAKVFQNKCKICDIPIRNDKQFCSVKCKSQSQIKLVTFKCDGCRKEIEIRPGLIRKTNYCSVDCYHASTRRKVIRICVICREHFSVKRYLIEGGFGKFCSLKCQHLSYKTKRIKLRCKACGKKIVKPPSVAKLTRFCSEACRDNNLRDYAIRICLTCGKVFQLPTWETKRGKGRFCSRFCYIRNHGESSLELKMRLALEKLRIKFQQEVKFGKFHADFVLTEYNIVIECDSYWHTSAYAKSRDRRKDELLRTLGYQIFRFSENQVKSSATKCVKSIPLQWEKT